MKSILGGPAQVNSAMITNLDGMEHTLLLGHIGMSPRDYENGNNDGPWSQAGPLVFGRTGTSFIKDTNDMDLTTSLGSPHRGDNIHPCLFAAGSVRLIAMDIDPDVYMLLWGYDDLRDACADR
jgi:hypothetical protein